MTKIVYAFLVFSLAAFSGISMVHAFDEGLVEAADAAVEEASDPSAFEGDSTSMPGERAPEEMPMDDAPVDAGFAIE